MRVLNNKYLRVSLIVCLILSMALTSAFAASYSVPYSEPPAGSDNGYISLGFSNGNVLTYWWSCSASTSGTQQLSSYCDISITGSTIQFTLGAFPPSSGSSFMYNISRRTGGNLWLMGSGSSTSASGVTFSHDFSAFGTLVDVYYAGNVNAVSFPSGLGSASISFESDSSLDDIYTKVDDLYDLLLHFNNNNDDNLAAITDRLISIHNSLVNLNNNNFDKLTDVNDSLTDINDTLGDLRVDVSNLMVNNQKWLVYIFDRLELTNVRLTSILSLLQDFAATTLDESTDPLPSQGLVDFESSQGSLRDDSDVSNNLDSVFNDADFGSFSNGFNVIWSLVDSVLNTNPIFFSLVILVLTLGLLNLIFNRR